MVAVRQRKEEYKKYLMSDVMMSDFLTSDIITSDIRHCIHNRVHDSF